MMPLVIETQRGRERLWDMYSRLLRDRIILLDEPIEDKTASMVCAQLLFLHAEHPGAPIQLLAAGEPGLRRALPSSRIMVHQPSGGFRGQATDAAIHTGEMLRLRAILDGILAACAGLAPDEVRSLTERDSYFSAPEARDLGLIDGIVRVR